MEKLAMLVKLGETELPADISLPERAAGLVVFAHGSGSSRHSPRNRHVAEVLNLGGIGTVLIDLLTEEEESVDVRTAELRFDIPFLSERLVRVTDWMHSQSGLRELPVGYFGASTGAAAALVAAAERPHAVRAIVSRGGRPDLTGTALQRVHAPVLFIVGSRDIVVLNFNHSAIDHLPLNTRRRLEVVPGATHLFEEPGALDRVASLALDWFHKYFTPTA